MRSRLYRFANSAPDPQISFFRLKNCICRYNKKVLTFFLDWNLARLVGLEVLSSSEAAAARSPDCLPGFLVLPEPVILHVPVNYRGPGRRVVGLRYRRDGPETLAIARTVGRVGEGRRYRTWIRSVPALVRISGLDLRRESGGRRGGGKGLHLGEGVLAKRRLLGHENLVDWVLIRNAAKKVAS